ncbi:hypothetical protein Hanom_Chr10g00873961 [Helianthus anomalus]
MELTSRIKMARVQTFWMQMRKNKPLDESRKTCQTSGTKMAFYTLAYTKYVKWTINCWLVNRQSDPNQFDPLSDPSI